MNPLPTSPAYLPTLRQLIRCTQAFERFSGVHVKSMGLTESQFADAADARRTHIALTRRGNVLFAEVFPEHLKHLQRAFGRVSATELDHLHDGLATLRLAFEKELAL